MKTAGIMTFLHNENCGSALQAYALQTALRGLGWTPLGLDYRPSRAEQVRNLLSSGNSPAVVLDSVLRRRGKGARNTAGFERFLRERLTLSAPCPNRPALRRAAAGCDVLLCGSDQIWSPEWLNPNYFFAFAPKDMPRVSYAPSLGVAAMPSPRKMRILQQCVSPFAAVSVREEAGREILRRLLPGREIAVMPDPVFLLTRADWLALCGEPATEPTLVTYFLSDQPAHWALAEETAAREGLALRPLAITAQARARTGAIDNPDPLQWLAAMAAASRVVTDSFHGAAFAALLGKPVTVCRRWRDDDAASKNSRIDQLFALTGWTPGAEGLPSPEVEARLAAERQRGLDWLAGALSSALSADGSGEAR